MAITYTLNKTDGTQLCIVNELVEDTTTIPLALFGKNRLNYGKKLNENFVKLLENFNDAAAPSNPLIGQLWYNRTTGDLKLYNGTTFAGLNADTLDGVHSDELLLKSQNLADLPDKATARSILSVYEKTQVYTRAETYSKTEAESLFVNVSGDTMTGFLSLHADPTNALHATTKQYVDNLGAYGHTDNPTIAAGTYVDYNLQTIFADAGYDARAADVGVKVLDVTSGSPTENWYIDAGAVATIAVNNTTVRIINEYTSALTFYITIIKV